MYCTGISWEWLAELGAAVAARCCKCPNAGGSYIVQRAYRPLGRNTAFTAVMDESHSSTSMAHGRLLKSPSFPALLESPTGMETVTWTKKEFQENPSHNEAMKTVALINTFETWSPTMLVLHPTHLGGHALRHLRRVQCCNNQPCPPLSFFQ